MLCVNARSSFSVLPVVRRTLYQSSSFGQVTLPVELNIGAVVGRAWLYVSSSSRVSSVHVVFQVSAVRA